MRPDPRIDKLIAKEAEAGRTITRKAAWYRVNFGKNGGIVGRPKKKKKGIL